MKKSINVEARTVSFDDEAGNVQTFELDKVSDEIRVRLALHGASQKVGDSYAGAGDSADPTAYANEAVKDTIAQLLAGEWRVGGGGGPRVSDLAQALSRISGESVEAVTEKLSKAGDEEKKNLRKHPQVAAILAAIKAENAAKRAATLAEKAKSGGEALSF